MPAVLLTARVRDDAINPPLLTATVDYEARRWRADELARHVLEWVLDYALRRTERERFNPGRALEVARQAVQATFGNGSDRGVPGEILLHAICRQFFGSDTVINKVWFKSSANDTYKGFDAVHCVHVGSRLELWLGEAKFYRDIGQAIQAVAADLDDHLAADYLRGEFALVASKIDDDHPHAVQLKRLMHPNTSLDEVFDQVVVPILLTYDSHATVAHQRLCPEYEEALEAEVRRIWMRASRALGTSLPVSVRLFLVPLATKGALQQALRTELARWR